ncbi:hypothetical protein Tco_1054105 [Tanacetum coccineum]|uniref:Eukaryotic translation initiation factor 3 subunit G N-terminal domain-containing protein n=1 Tax=Tanacetum coccineum TaxID=301880 RepID=A0ABQ5GY97_9ASTR
MAAYSQKWHNGTSRTRSTETSDGLAAIQTQLNNIGREIKKVNEKVYAAQVGCEQCKGPHYTKDCPLKEEGKTLEESYYTQFGGPFQGGDIEQQLQDSIKGTMQILHFAVLEDMDAYRDEGMGDVIVGELFLREVGIKARRFEGMITIYDGNNEVTYQMVRSHPRFKRHTNKQCNKIPPLLKVSEEDEMNGISYAYQKLKGFYKGVLNLGPDYIRDEKTEEWLTRGHISDLEKEISTKLVECIFSGILCDLDNSTSNVLIPLDSWTSGLLVYKLPLSVRMTKVIKGEFEKIKDVKVEDVSLTCYAPLEVFNNEVSRLSGMNDDLFTYEVEVANILCDSKMDDDLENEADDDMGYDPSDVAFIE